MAAIAVETRWLEKYDHNTSSTVKCFFFGVLLTVHLSVYISAINELDAQNFRFTISLFLVHETATYMCDDTRGCITQF